MHRQRIELCDIAALHNLQLASYKAAQGKRARPDVARFIAGLDNRLEQLHTDILAGRVPYGQYRSFIIHDPKQRLIHAACFEDRVLHHAIMNLAEPVFEKSLVPSTYACRPGKGVHRAVFQVQRNLQRYPWFVQVDVKGYFPSIDHQRLLLILDRRFKGRDFMALLSRIVLSYQSSPGKGLPIGSLTSQHFANYYLDGADRFLLGHPSVSAHVRYMDDIVWWCQDKECAKQVLLEVSDYLAEVCKLHLKAKVMINQSVLGLTYCGFRICPGIIRLTKRKQRRYRLLCQGYEENWAHNLLSDRELQTRYDAVLAGTLPARSQAWRKQDLQLHPSVYENGDG
ncbi:MAG: reverse transcriptase/maturase family protein [Methylococcaceae bacterium]